MNRLPLPADSAMLSQQSQPETSSSLGPFLLSKHLDADESLSNRLGDSSFCNTPHSLFAPIHYEDGYAYPLILWLHGPGDNEHQLRTVMPLVSMRNYIAIAPRGINADVDVRGAYRWQQSSDDISSATERSLDCIKFAMDRFHIHRERIFIAGYDCGGTMALRIALENPEYFAGAISLGGPLPQKSNLLRRINAARHLPLMIANAMESQKYTTDQVCSDLRLMHTAGCSLDLRRYPCGDELTTKMLSDLDCWIMQRICAKTASVGS